jgi:hypothetical protein
MLGDYTAYKRFYTNKSIDRTIVAADTSAAHADVISPRNSLHTIYIQKIILSITTHAAQTITFRDGAGTPVVIAAHTDAATGLSVVEWDFGPEGTPLTQGEELDIILSAAGIAARVHIEAYEKLTGVGAPA